MSKVDLKADRPLSPHLQIYKPALTMVMSVFHRITGAALYFGTILLAWWLMAAAGGPHYFEFTQNVFGSFIGRLVLFGYTWALMHHMLGGIRHFIWDTGAGFEPNTREWLARATLAGSVSLTFIIWLIGYAVRM
ncbi:MAG: succinate dehydrogenase, cytochrome b556 subunit [Hyphomicrobiales bacterium]|nr:succinate dehydrogenase, cytochrome b556 subunit [Hyphomicrobiales bacterium]